MLRELGWGGWVLAGATVLWAVLVWVGLSSQPRAQAERNPVTWTERGAWGDIATWTTPWTTDGLTARWPWQHPRADIRPTEPVGPDGLSVFAEPVSIGSVDAASWSPDGSTLATGGEDGAIRLWSRTGQPELTLFGHIGTIESIAWSPDGTRLVSGSGDRTVRLWSVSGESLGTLTGHTATVNAVAWSRDGTRIASGSDDGSVRLWSASGEDLVSFNGQTLRVLSVSWSPDGSRLATGGADATVRLWSATGEPLETLAGHAGRVHSVSWSPDGARLASGSGDGTVRLWGASGDPLATLPDHVADVFSVAWSEDGSRLATAGRDETVRLWSNSGEPQETLTGHTGPVRAVSWSRGRGELASASEDGTVRLWSSAGETVERIAGSTTAIWSMAWSREADQLVFASFPGPIHIRSGSGADQTTLGEDDDWHSSLAWSPDGTRIASGSDDGTVSIWSTSGEAPEILNDGGDRTRSPVSAIAWSSDGDQVASAHSDGTIRLRSMSGSTPRTLEGHRDTVRSVAWSPDGTRLVSGSDDGAVRLWTATGESLATLDDHGDRALGVAWSPDGDRLASAGSDGTVRLWSEQGVPLAILDGDGDELVATAWALDGAAVLALDRGGDIRLWSADGTFIGEWTDGLPSLGALAMVGDRRLLIGTGVGVIHSLDIAAFTATPAAWARLLLVLGFAPVGGLAFTGFRAYRRVRDRRSAQDRVAIFLDADTPLDDPTLAGPALGGLAKRLSRFIRNRNVAAPLTFALVGDWGSGKSSAMKLVQTDLERRRHPVVWFNAWHHQNEEHLFAALMDVIRREAAPPMVSWRNLAFRGRLLLMRYDDAPLWNFLRLVTFLFIASAVVIVAPNVVEATFDRLRSVQDPSAIGVDAPWVLQWLGRLIGLALVSGGFGVPLLGELVQSFATRPSTLLAGPGRGARLARFDDRLGFRHRFAEEFRTVCAAMGDRRLVIVIDDLDRCHPDRMVELLEAVNFLATSGSCFIVMGLSERPVRHAIGLDFADLATELRPGAKAPAGTGGGPPKDEKEEEEERRSHRLSFAEHYLEKVINLQIPVPQFSTSDLGQWVAKAPAALAERNKAIQKRRFREVWRVRLFLALAVAVAAILVSWIIVPWTAERSPSAPEMAPPSTEVEDRTRQAAPEEPASPPTGEDPTAPLEMPPILLPEPRAAPTAPWLVDQLSRYGFPLAALVVMILTAIAVNSPRMKALLGGQTADRQDDPDILGDSPDFRNAFATWAPLVLARRGSPRAVKRFANRMRYLVADPEGTATADQIRGLMALGALDEIGAIWPDMTIGRHTGHKAFRCWLKPSNDVLQELQKNADSPDTFNDTLNAIDAETWAEYWELAQSVRFSDGGGSETAAAASGRA